MATGIFEIVPAISAFVKLHLENTAAPQFTWQISADTGAITATLNEFGVVVCSYYSLQIFQQI